MMSRKPPRILLVDDEEDIAYVLKRGLEIKGFEVDSFTNPVQAAQHFESNYFDAVITDIRMPQMSGLDLYQKIRENDAAVRVYFMSAYDSYEKEIKEKFAENELITFIKKPTPYATLAEILKKDLEKKRVTSYLF